MFDMVLTPLLCSQSKFTIVSDKLSALTLLVGQQEDHLAVKN